MTEHTSPLLMGARTKTVHQCTICVKEFVTKRDLLLHQYIHKEKPNFTCVSCNKSFPNEAAFKRHSRVHTRGKRVIACKLCEETFDNGRALEDHHRENHLDEKKFRCETCGAEFSWRDNLLKHERMHAAETHICDVCNKGFMDNTSLRVHVRNHHSNIKDPEKPYICGVCNKAFKFDFSYEAHLNAHERPPSAPRYKASPGARTNHVAISPTPVITLASNQPQTPQSDKEIILEIVNVGNEYGKADTSKLTVDMEESLQYATDNMDENEVKESDLDLNQTTTIVVSNGSQGATQHHVVDSPLYQSSADDSSRPGPSGVVRQIRKKKRESEPLMFDFVMSEEKPYACVICGQEFRWEISLQIHMKTHEVGYIPPVRGKAKRALGRGSSRHSGDHTLHQQKSSRIVGKRSGSDSEGELEEEFVYVDERGQPTSNHLLVVPMSAAGVVDNTCTIVQPVEVTTETIPHGGDIITVVSEGGLLESAPLQLGAQ